MLPFELAPSQDLTSRVTPRSPKKWKSPKSIHPGPTNRSLGYKAHNFSTPPSASYHSSGPIRKGTYSPRPSPKSLIERLNQPTSPTTRAAAGSEQSLLSSSGFSSASLLDRLTQSEPSNAVIYQNPDVGVGTSENNEVLGPSLIDLEVLALLLYSEV